MNATRSPAVPAAGPKRTASPAQDSIALPGGVRIDHLTQGDPAGPPVVLLHGYSDSCRSYKPVLEALPSSVRLAVPSLRGHGDSSRPEAGYRTRDFAEDIAEYLRVLDLERAVVVGHSMGSAIAMRMAIDHP